jgi:hypothetical protein
MANKSGRQKIQVASTGQTASIGMREIWREVLLTVPKSLRSHWTPTKMTIVPAPALRLLFREGRSLPGVLIPSATAASSCRVRACLARNHRLASGSFCRHGRRTVVTSSTPPSPDVFIERPEVVVLAESSLYGTSGGGGRDNSWEGRCGSFFPESGLHFASIDVFRSTSGRGGGDHPDDDDFVPSLDALERNMVEDLAHLGDDVVDGIFIGDVSSTSAHVLLIARGPVQCLVAQYFLER